MVQEAADDSRQILKTGWWLFSVVPREKVSIWRAPVLEFLFVLHTFLASRDTESDVPENPGTCNLKNKTAELSGSKCTRNTIRMQMHLTYGFIVSGSDSIHTDSVQVATLKILAVPDKQQALETLECEPSQIVCNSVKRKDHLNGEKHGEMVALAARGSSYEQTQTEKTTANEG